MNSPLLTSDERKRFIEYLAVEVTSSQGIMQQLGTVPMPDPVRSSMIERERILIAACSVLIDRLNSAVEA